MTCWKRMTIGRSIGDRGRDQVRIGADPGRLVSGVVGQLAEDRDGGLVGDSETAAGSSHPARAARIVAPDRCKAGGRVQVVLQRLSARAGKQSLAECSADRRAGVQGDLVRGVLASADDNCGVRSDRCRAVVVSDR